MPTGISYNTEMNMIHSWDRLKMMKGYEQKAGALICERFFELEPEAHDLFHFDVERQRSHKHAHEFKAKMMVEMIDFAVGAIGFLGPDLELLHDDLVTEGRKHHKNGIVSRHLYSMEHAVVYMLEEMLGDDFRREDRRAWELIFQMIIKAMVEGMRQAEAEEDAKK